MNDKAITDGSGSVLPVEEIHLALLQALPEGMCFVDLQGAIRFWNDEAESVTGFSVAEAVCARHLTDVFSLNGTDGHPIAMIPDSIKPNDYYLRHKDGHSIPIAVRRLVVRAQNGHPLGTLLLFETTASFARDTLIGHGDVPDPWRNREEMRESPRWPSVEGRAVGLLLIQIDEFEEIEHRLGPEASEKVFALVERTTTTCLNTDETCRRLPRGSVLASINSTARLAPLAHKLRALIQSSRIHWWGEAVTVTVSIAGTSIGPHDTSADAVRRVEDCVLALSSAGGNQVMTVD